MSGVCHAGVEKKVVAHGGSRKWRVCCLLLTFDSWKLLSFVFTALFCVCALYSPVLSRPSPRPHLHHNPNHSSLFILHPSSLLYSTTCTVHLQRQQHHSICFYLSLTSYTCLVLSCLVLRHYSAGLTIICIVLYNSSTVSSRSSCLYDYFWPFRSRLHPYQLPTNLTARSLPCILTIPR